METLEEKQRELDVLQAEFDEYIASSREMEGELEAELARCHDEKSNAESRALALAAQLAEVQPQLTSLESKLSAVAKELSSETQRRIAAETRTEEAEKKQREAEGTLEMVRSKDVKNLRDEIEELCERIAFVEGEAEDCRNELTAERERRREEVEVEALQFDVDVLRGRLTEQGENVDATKNDEGDAEKNEGVYDNREVGNCVRTIAPDKGDATHSDQEQSSQSLEDADQKPSSPGMGDREQFVRSLESKLETVTHQLMDSEAKLALTQRELEQALARETPADKKSANGTDAESKAMASNGDAVSNKIQTKIADLESTTNRLREDNASLQEQSKQTTSCCTIS